MEEDIKDKINLKRYKELYNFLIGTPNRKRKRKRKKQNKNGIKLEKIFFEEFEV